VRSGRRGNPARDARKEALRVLCEPSAASALNLFMCHPVVIQGTRMRPLSGPVEQSGRKLRVLVISHSHPQITKGGAEIAAHALFEAVARSDCDAWFLGCDRTSGIDRSGNPIRQPYSSREYVYLAGEFNWFNFANRDPNFPGAFAALLTELNPDIVHFHHYSVLGVEALAIARQVVPDAKIVLTLHEYLAICHHYGQMVTRPDRTLCFEASVQRCASCFPDVPRSDFFLRRIYIQRFFSCVDQFISPSRFLAERYKTWGVPAEKISVLENVVRPRTDAPKAKPFWGKKTLRVGFFGQISPLKGINVLLDAASLLEKRERFDIAIDVFGEHRNQPAELQEEFQTRIAAIGKNVCLHGAYEPDRIDALMQSVDIVVVPSIWWENSPVVIQEAFLNRRPVICSDIGGMAEKVRDGLDGFHFSVRSAVDLAALIERLADDRDLLGDIENSIRMPAGADEACQKHLALYRDIIKTATLSPA
jgi:glycosyltransferase involved in cell wall biosynthesis